MSERKERLDGLREDYMELGKIIGRVKKKDYEDFMKKKEGKIKRMGDRNLIGGLKK